MWVWWVVGKAGTTLKLMWIGMGLRGRRHPASQTVTVGNKCKWVRKGKLLGPTSSYCPYANAQVAFLPKTKVPLPLCPQVPSLALPPVLLIRVCWAETHRNLCASILVGQLVRYSSLPEFQSQTFPQNSIGSWPLFLGTFSLVCLVALSVLRCQ
jgi:hypothetical protein